MRSIAVLLCLVVIASAFTLYDDVLTEEWNAFKLEHAKQYTGEEEQRRMQIYAENRLFIAQHNERYEQGLETYKVAPNKFADMSDDEFVRVMVGFNITAGADRAQRNHSMDGATPFVGANVWLPPHKDWRRAVTPVKDQGGCNSCWAFSAVGAIESHNYLKTGRLVALSEQNLMDCSWTDGNYGCRGGFITNSYKYVKFNKGIDTELSYPYQGVDSIRCRFKRKDVGAGTIGYVAIPYGNEQFMQQAVAVLGPVAVSIDATRKGFRFYSKGVYYDSECSQSLTHSVLVVGYGIDNQIDYWLLKNSWGTGWGEKGYGKMARNKNNNCGIASDASYPIV